MSVRPRLVPGAVVVRRDARHLLVGTDPGVVVRDRPGLLALLRLVDGVKDVNQLAVAADPVIAPDVPEVLRELLARGVLEGDPPAPRPRLDVTVRATDATRSVARAVRTVLAGLDLAPAGPDGPSLVVQLSAGEPPRGTVAPLAAGGVPHLLVTALGRTVRVGPLVVPGLSPCVRCLDLARSDRDPAWEAVLTQLDRPPLAPARADLTPLAQWDLAVCVGAQVHALAQGSRPPAAGALLRLSDGRTAVEPFDFHHRCGCWLLEGPLDVPAVS